MARRKSQITVFDTTVFAYALLGEPAFREKSLAALETATEIAAPELLYAELTNVVWKWVKARRLTPAEALPILENAERLVTRFYSGARLWEAALLLSMEANHPVYDAFYVAVAREANTKVVTYDKRFRVAFPMDTESVCDYLS